MNEKALSVARKVFSCGCSSSCFSLVSSAVRSAPGPGAFDAAGALLRLIPHRCRMYQRGVRAKSLDDRDGFGRRRFQQQCETILPHAVSSSLPPLSFLLEHRNDTEPDAAGN